jgi:serine/threonine protein kinase
MVIANPTTSPKVHHMQKYDVWSLGCLIIEVTLGLFPYGDNGEEAERRMLDGDEPFADEDVEALLLEHFSQECSFQ